MEINKQGKVHHETEICEYRRLKCHDCAQIQDVMGRLEGKIVQLDRKVGETRGEIKKAIQEVRNLAKNTGDKVEAINEETKAVSRQTEKEIEEDTKEIREVKIVVKDENENFSQVNKDLDDVKVMMSQVLEKLLYLNISTNCHHHVECTKRRYFDRRRHWVAEMRQEHGNIFL